MNAAQSAASLESICDHLSDIREILGERWADFARHVWPKVVMLAQHGDADDAELVIEEIASRLAGTPAEEIVRDLIRATIAESEILQRDPHTRGIRETSIVPN